MSDKTKCGECGMVVGTNEYHPYAACLMFKGCNNGGTVRDNIKAIAEQKHLEVLLYPGELTALQSKLSKAEADNETFKKALNIYADRKDFLWEKLVEEPDGIHRYYISGTAHPNVIARRAIDKAMQNKG